MKMWKKLTAAVLSALLAGMMAMPALAAETRTKIEKVSLTFTAYDNGDEGEYGEVEVTGEGSTYSVEDVEFLSSSAATGSGYPRIKVTLYADDDYYFGSSNKSLFSLSGEGATYVSASLRDSKQRAVVTVQLKKYSGAQADVAEDVDWDYEGSGNWSEVPNAAYYEVRLKRGNTVIGDVLKIDDTTVDFRSMITQTGRYTFQVRTVNRYVTANKSKWVSSERWEVDEEILQMLRQSSGSTNNYYNSGNNNYNNNYTASNPFASITGWQLDNVGYWYRNYDGTYPASAWQQINGFWYYFNASGYMAVNQWVVTNGYYYYVGADGKMLTNTRTPDNFYVDANGMWVPGI